MILWIIRQLLSLRQAVLGRAHPSELAWGLAIGVGIGLIPKGNLVSLMLIGSLVTLRVNHGMAALAAVACSFLAGRIDPWTHELGVLVLGAEQVRPFMERIWSWPLMPWTDLNNTVVMGSTVAAGVALLPTYAVSLPLFHWLGSRTTVGQGTPDPAPVNPAVSDSEAETVHQPNATEAADEGWESERPAAEAEAVESLSHVETRIDVIRLKTVSSEDDPSTGVVEPVSGGQMNEALGYLLRRLRDSRQGKAA